MKRRTGLTEKEKDMLPTIEYLRGFVKLPQDALVHISNLEMSYAKALRLLDAARNPKRRSR